MNTNNSKEEILELALSKHKKQEFSEAEKLYRIVLDKDENNYKKFLDKEGNKYSWWSR